MAITAWSAKVVTSSIWLSVKGSAVDFKMAMTPRRSPSRSIGIASTAR